MNVQPLTRADDSSAITNAISSSSGNQDLGQTEFLKLLTTELSNQDPLSPTDNKEFLAQLAQFSTVEGVTNLEKSQTHLQAAQMLGKYADATIVESGKQKIISGQITAVRWSGSSVSVTLQESDAAKTTHDVTLSEISQVSDSAAAATNQ